MTIEKRQSHRQAQRNAAAKLIELNNDLNDALVAGDRQAEKRLEAEIERTRNVRDLCARRLRRNDDR